MDPLLQQPIVYGQTSAGVKALQNFLISQGVSIPAGATGYFGDQTKAALSQWQNSQGVTGAGIGTNWGPQSMAKAKAIPASSSSMIGPVQPMIGPTKPTVNSTGSSSPIINNQTNISYDEQAVRNGVINTATNLIRNSGGDPTAASQYYSQLLPQYKALVVDLPGFGKNVDPNYVPKTSLINSDTSKTGTSSTTVPEAIINSGITNSSLGALRGNSAALSSIIPELTPGSPEYQAAMDKINNAYFDVLQASLTAKTQGEQVAAKTAWDTLRDHIQKNLGISLADDAYKAYGQMQSLKDTMGQRNLEGSGIQNQSMDDYLNSIRRTDAQNREQSVTEQDQAQRDYMMKFGTPQQIAALDPQKATAWGLKPSSEVLAALDSSTMKAKYPGISDADIQSYRASVLDENGNLRSSLYKQYMTGQNLGVDTAKIDTATGPSGVQTTTVTPGDYGMLDIQKAAEQNKKAQIDTNRANEINKVNQQIVPPTSVTDPKAGSSGSSLFSDPATADQATKDALQKQKETAGIY